MELLPTTWLAQLSLFLFWTQLYLYLCATNPNRNPEWCSRSVTLLHGTVASIIGLWLCGAKSITACSLTARVGYFHYALMLWSWGYFAFDLMWCLIYWSDHKLILFHHACALGAVSCYLSKENTGCVFPCTIALMEITNPLLQLRWFLRNEGYDKCLIFYAIEITYLILFLGLRGILGSYLIVKIVLSDLFKFEDKLLSLALYFVSIAFISEILGYVLYKYKHKIDKFQGLLIEMAINNQIDISIFS